LLSERLAVPVSDKNLSRRIKSFLPEKTYLIIISQARGKVKRRGFLGKNWGFCTDNLGEK
jgi:hypothetical protein